jgi:MYXO-CTERM domain-containing protein
MDAPLPRVIEPTLYERSQGSALVVLLGLSLLLVMRRRTSR